MNFQNEDALVIKFYLKRDFIFTETGFFNKNFCEIFLEILKAILLCVLATSFRNIYNKIEL